MGNRIRELRRKMDISQSELAEKMGFKSQQQIAYYENTSRKLNSEMALKFAGFFNVSLEYLLGEECQSETDNPVSNGGNIAPIIGTVSAGFPIFSEQNVDGYMMIPDDVKETFVLKVEGDSMNQAGLPEGSYVLVHKQSAVENGDIAVVLVNENETLVKRFYQNDYIVTLKPESSNPIHKEQIFNLLKTNVFILGRVIGVYNRI